MFGVLVVTDALDVMLISKQRVWKFGGSSCPLKVPTLYGNLVMGSLEPGTGSRVPDNPFAKGVICRKLVLGNGPSLIPEVALSSWRIIVFPWSIATVGHSTNPGGNIIRMRVPTTWS